MAIFTALIPLIAIVGKWLIERNLMSAAATKQFLLWVKQTSKEGAISAKLSLAYEELIKKQGG